MVKASIHKRSVHAGKVHRSVVRPSAVAWGATAESRFRLVKAARLFFYAQRF